MNTTLNDSKIVGQVLAYALHDAAMRFAASYDAEEGKHTLSVAQACEKTCQQYQLAPSFAPLMVLLLNERNWNESCTWADYFIASN